MTQGNLSPVNSTTTSTTAAPVSTTAVQGADQHHLDQDKSPTLTDTIAAVTIAVLACVLIITLTLIVRAVRRQRRRERGRELNAIPTVSTGIVSANVSAYATSSRSSPRPARGIISWEPVTPSTSTADIMPSTSGAGAPSSC
ncbi:uncharacterized protein [Littorina saxatilis]|uniref:Uncharacterized protein n=1 Tax=Littorina saxatilis TaxID=31220 RepID=A0AAN9BXT6_9CAEN